MEEGGSRREEGGGRRDEGRGTRDEGGEGRRLIGVRVPAQTQAQAQAYAKPVGGSRTTMKSGRGGRGSPSQT